MKNKKKLLLITVVVIVVGCVLAISYLHRRQLAMRDFNPTEENLRKIGFPSNKVYFNDDIYHNPGHRFSLRPPKGWLIKEYDTQMYGMAVKFEDSNNAHITVYIEDPKGQDLQQFVDQYKRVLGDKVISEESLDSIIGTKGYILEILQPQPKFATQQKNLIVVDGDKAYIVSVSAVQDKWENYENLFASVLSSFKLEILLY